VVKATTFTTWIGLPWVAISATARCPPIGDGADHPDQARRLDRGTRHAPDGIAGQAPPELDGEQHQAEHPDQPEDRGPALLGGRRGVPAHLGAR
jgi:hypothetical protein